MGWFKLKKILLALLSSIIGIGAAIIPYKTSNNKNNDEVEFQNSFKINNKQNPESRIALKNGFDDSNKEFVLETVSQEIEKLTKCTFYSYNFFFNELLKNHQSKDTTEIVNEFYKFYQKLINKYNSIFIDIFANFKKNPDAIFLLNKIQKLNEITFKQSLSLFNNLIKAIKIEESIDVIDKFEELNKNIWNDYLNNFFDIINEFNQFEVIDSELIILEWKKEFDKLYNNEDDFTWEFEEENEDLQANFNDLMIEFKEIINDIFDHYLVNLDEIINNSEGLTNDIIVLFKEFNEETIYFFVKAFDHINIDGFNNSEYQVVQQINQFNQGIISQFNQGIISQFKSFEDLNDWNKKLDISEILIDLETLINKIKFDYLSYLNNIIKGYQYENIDILIDKINVLSDNSLNELTTKIDKILKEPQPQEPNDAYIFDDHINSVLKNDIDKTIKKLREFFNKEYDWNLSFNNNGQDVLDKINSELKNVLTSDEYQAIKIKFFDEEWLNEYLDDKEVMLQLIIEINNKIIDGTFYLNLENIKN